jgi:hypothetical protein
MRLVGRNGCRRSPKGQTRSLINVDRPAVRHQFRERGAANDSLSNACGESAVLASPPMQCTQCPIGSGAVQALDSTGSES